jgi:hypothetical protein
LWHEKRHSGGSKLGSITFPDDEYQDDASDEDLKELFGTQKSKKKKTKIRTKPLIVAGSATVLLIVYILFKASIFSFIGSASDSIVDLFDKDDTIQSIVDADTTTSMAEPIDLQNPDTPSGISTGEILETFYNSADETNTDIAYMILQDNLVRCELAGEDQDIVDWSQRISSIDENAVQNISEPAQLASGSILKIDLEQSSEASMTEMQFSELARSLGINSHGTHAYRCDRAGLMRLFGVLKGERTRLFRLSVQHRTGDDYLLVMFP